MNKKDLIASATEILKNNDVRKPITASKTVLHISDDSGNNSDFVIKKPERGLLFTNRDVTIVLDALIAAVEQSIRNGDAVTIHGFGTLGLNRRAARRAVHPETGEPVVVPACIVPKFSYGTILKRAAKLYEMDSESNMLIEDNKEDING